jgi:hypothetical protein
LGRFVRGVTGTLVYKDDRGRNDDCSPPPAVSRFREPVGSEAVRPFPHEAVFLAAAPKRAIPEPYHVAMERCDCRAVRGNRVIGEVSSDDLPQPTSLFGYRLMQALAQLLLDLGELRPHAVAPALAVDENLPRRDLPQMKTKPRARTHKFAMSARPTPNEYPKPLRLLRPETALSF